jgi:O-antigen ligase
MSNSSTIRIQSITLDKICILCACIIPLLVTGPFLPDLVISILSLFFLYYSFKYKIYFIYFNKYFIFFIAFCIVCIFSSLISDDISFSLESSLFYFRIGVFALFISYLIDQNKKILHYFYLSFFITFLVLVVDGYIEFFSGSNILGNKFHPQRVSSFFGNELILGSYLSRLLPLFIALFVIREKKTLLEVCGFVVLLFLVYILILFSGERSAFFFVNLSLLFIALFSKQKKLFMLLFFLISLTLSTFFIEKNSSLYERYIKSTFYHFGLNDGNKIKYIFTAGHDSLIRTALNMFLDKPIIGHGPKLFRKKCKNPIYAEGVAPCNTHPHNFYVQLLAETGITGFFFLAGLFMFFLYLVTKHLFILIKTKKYFFSNYNICLLASLLITIWPLTSNGNFFNNYLMILYSLNIGFFNKNL